MFAFYLTYFTSYDMLYILQFGLLFEIYCIIGGAFVSDVLW